MDILELIKKRRSVRTFDGVSLSSEDANKIMRFAEEVENPYNLPIQWTLLDAKAHHLSSPVIVGTDIYIAGKMHRSLHAEEDFGYSFERIVLFAESLGVGTTWIAGTMDRTAFEKAVSLKDDEVLPCVSPLGYPSKKMSLREGMMRKGIKADTRKEFGELIFDSCYGCPLTKEEAGRLAKPLEAVLLAPSAVNKQPWRIVVCGDAVHFYAKHGRGYSSENGWDIQKIDLGIALCHFELAAKACGLQISFTIDEPKLLSPPEDAEYVATFAVE